MSWMFVLYPFSPHMKSNRTEIVYDIYSFLYREPQHLGKMKNPESAYTTYDKAMTNMQKKEVSLNHLANIFFSFLPSDLLHQFFLQSVQKSLQADEYDLFVRSLDKVVQGIGDFTQPDIFFVGEQNTISLEMKIGAKSSLEQLMKYAFLHYKEQETSGVQKVHHLIYLGKWAFTSLREEKFDDVEALKNAFTTYQIPQKSKKWKISLGQYTQEIRSMVEQMNISYILYTDLKQFCLDNLPDQKANRQLYKLLQGMIEELEMRRLA